MLDGLWTGLVLLALVWGLLEGRAGAVSAAAVEGAGAAVELCLGLCGAICLWTGVLRVLERSGAAQRLSRLLRPLLRPLFPRGAKDPKTLDALAENLSANLLGLGNAATPAGLRAAKGLRRLQEGDKAGAELCRLVVLNSASVQLIPTTICALRAAAGSRMPFDILPAVWMVSAAALLVGLLTLRLLEGRGRP